MNESPSLSSAVDISLDVDVLRPEPLIAETPAPALQAAVTPAQNVYVRSNFPTPRLGEDHRVHIGGAVAQSMDVSLADLHQFEQRTIVVTMECAGNDRLGMRPVPGGEPWNHGAISTVEWTGVPLRQLLERAELAADVIEIVAYGADFGARDGHASDVQFARALPRSVAMHDDTLVAVAMNGEPLHAEHGAPMRLAVPRWYGMASVKWLTRLEAVTVPFEGHFQRERYVYDAAGTITPVTTMRVKSFVASPLDGDRVAPGAVVVSGWAWSGNGAIAGVDVSINDGEWMPATLDNAVSPYAWVAWHIEVQLAQPGIYQLRSRASDGTGDVQPDAIAWNRLGYGNNAIRVSRVAVGDAPTAPDSPTTPGYDRAAGSTSSHRTHLR